MNPATLRAPAEAQPAPALKGRTAGDLQALQVFAESALPPHVQRVPRPPALGRAVSLAFMRWEKRDLSGTERFWRDFGLHITESTSERVLARAAGPSACVAMAMRGERSRFVGAAFTMSESTELLHYVREFGARWLREADIPGGGRGVELLDPAGRPLWLLQGQAAVPTLPLREPATPLMNSASTTQRVNRMVRTPIEPAQVVKLGHLVMQTVDLAAMLDWYMRVLGLIPTDVHYLADGSPVVAFLRLNLGDVPADHHSLVLVGGIEEKYEHSAYEVLDLEAVGQGQQVLRARGHSHMWGIGRHLIGSQIFDYWKDPDGFQHEHYTDGDVFTADFETQYSPMGTGAIWSWGADAPPAMLPQKNLRTLLQVLSLLRKKKITPQRLKLIGQALGSPARPWL